MDWVSTSFDRFLADQLIPFAALHEAGLITSRLLQRARDEAVLAAETGQG